MWNANVQCREREVREAKEWGSSSERERERERERGKWDRKRNGTEHDSYYIFLVWALGVYHFFVYFCCSVVSPLSVFFALYSSVIPPTHRHIEISRLYKRQVCWLTGWLTVGPILLALGERYVCERAIKCDGYTYRHTEEKIWWNMVMFFMAIWTSSLSVDVGESEQVERTNERTFGTNTTMNQTRTTFAILRHLNHRYDDDGVLP